MRNICPVVPEASAMCGLSQSHVKATGDDEADSAPAERAILAVDARTLLREASCTELQGGQDFRAGFEVPPSLLAMWF